jgi:hypothetical protein
MKKDHIYHTCAKLVGYIAGFSVASGLGNGLEFSERNITLDYSLFNQGFRNHLKLAGIVATTYPFVMNALSKTNHHRLYANLYQVMWSCCFFAWHTYQGTDNSLETITPTTIAGFLMLNYQVSKIKHSLEEKINENTTDIPANG